MQRDEAELARMGRRARDDHAARFEERTEGHSSVGRGRGSARNGVGKGMPAPARASSSTSASTATGLPSTTMSGLRSTDDVGPVVGEPGEADQRRRDGRPIDGGLAAERPEQLLGREIVEKLVGVELGERDQPEGDVAEGFGEHSPDAEHDARTELRIAHEPRDELARAAHHRRHEELDRAVVGAGRGEELGRGRADRGRVGQSEPDEAALGLVGDGVAAQLDDHRVAELVCGRDGCVGVGRRPLVEHRHAVTREQLLRRGFREGRHGGRG